MSVLNNVATTDGYTDATTVAGPNSVRVRIIVRNASIYYQYGRGGVGGRVDFDSQREKGLPPGTYSWDESERPVDAIRVRSFTPGVPARVFIDMVTTDG